MFIIRLVILICCPFLCSALFGVDLSIIKVGQANFTILRSGDRALIYDCGYSGGRWIQSGEFTDAKNSFLRGILHGVKSFGILISHDDRDHGNLRDPLLKLFQHLGAVNAFDGSLNGLGPDAVISRKRKNLHQLLLDLQNFMTNQNITLYSFFPHFDEDESVATNDQSVILKISCVCGEDSKVFLMTGDATDKTLQAIRGENFFMYGNDANQNLLRYEGRRLFENVVCFMPAHHGAATDGSFGWSREVFRKSRFPVLTVISSDPKSSSHSPSFDTILELSNLSHANLANFSALRYYCVPHVVDCYWCWNNNETQGCVDLFLKISAIMKYPPIRGHYILPIFVTSNTLNLFSVSLNDGIIQLNDNGYLLYKCDLFFNEDYELLSDACLSLAYGRLIKELRDIVNYRLSNCAGLAEQQYWNYVQRNLELIGGYEIEDDKLRVLENDTQMVGISHWLRVLVAELKDEYSIPLDYQRPMEE